jgi:glycosyltransferase involved in cell wall biosynthesis
MSPTISVIVTVYNRFELTKRAVESVLAQTLPVSEILIMDDGSFDGTSELLPQHIADNPAWRERVRYTHQENQGPGVSRNNGIALAKGEWLAFLDNDDLWLPQKLEWQFRALEQFQDECGACITDAWFMNNQHMKMTLFQLTGKHHTELIGMIGDPLTYILQKTSAVGGHPVWLQNLVVRTDLARRAGGFDPQLRFGDDDDFVFRLGCETKFCYVNMPMVLIDRTPPAERHVGANRRWDDEDFRLQMAQHRYEKRLGMSERLPGKILESVRKDLSAVHSGWANWFLQKGEYGSARQSASDAVRMHFTPNLAIKWALARSAPKLARKMALMRNEYRRRRIYGIG